MYKNKLLFIILICSLFINIWLGIQYNALAKQAEVAFIGLANQTKGYINMIRELTTKPEIDWEDTPYKLELDNYISDAYMFAYSTQNLSKQRNINYSEIRYDLGTFAHILSSIRMEVGIWGDIRGDSPLSEEDKQTLIKLGNNLVEAGFNEQVQEDNGEDFKNSLKKFLKYYLNE